MNSEIQKKNHENIAWLLYNLSTTVISFQGLVLHVEL